MPTVKFTYPYDAEKVFKFLADPEVARRRSEAFGDTEINVSKNGNTVVNRRSTVAEVPSFAAKFLSPRNTVTDTKTFNEAAKTAALSVEIQGAPLSIAGTIKVVPNGSGADHVLDFKVTCKIPLIGGKLESHVAGITERGMTDEFAWNSKELANYAG